MKLSYFELLSGEPTYLNGVGHIRSPKLKELFPSGRGELTYNFYLCLLSWNTNSLIDFLEKTERKKYTILRNEKITVFDIVTLVNKARGWYAEMLSFFIVEEIFWDSKTSCFFLQDKERKVVGLINRANCSSVFKAILEANYLFSEEEAKAPIKHSSARSKELWERAQQYQKDLEKKDKKPEDNPKYHLSNVISKLCVFSTNYNLLNVGELTVFQLYDQFFQCGSKRMSDLADNAYATHGGDKYGYDNWLGPVNQNI